MTYRLTTEQRAAITADLQQWNAEDSLGKPLTGGMLRHRYERALSHLLAVHFALEDCEQENVRLREGEPIPTPDQIEAYLSESSAAAPEPPTTDGDA